MPTKHRAVSEKLQQFVMKLGTRHYHIVIYILMITKYVELCGGSFVPHTWKNKSQVLYLLCKLEEH